MYAITSSSYRAITPGTQLQSGETASEDVPSAVLNRIHAEQVRSERAQRLRDTDWTQMDDAPLSLPQKLAWGVYRQALRDLPSIPGFPDVIWPSPPNLPDGAAGNAPAIPIP